MCIMKLRYISDIHLEFLKKYPLLTNKDYDNTTLCLLGDVGYPESEIYKNFIKHCSKTFKNTIVLYGNHEYYSKIKTKITIDEKLLLTNDFPDNVYFLDNNCIYLNTITNNVTDVPEEHCVKIIGSTLWSNIDEKITCMINDYNCIYVPVKNSIFTSKKLTYNDTIQMYNKSIEYILNEIKKNIKCILLTHHGVHPLCNGKYSNNDLCSAYASDIPELYKCNNLLACINGHTHQNIYTVIPETNIKLLSNCLGYRSEHLCCDLNKEIEVKQP